MILIETMPVLYSIGFAVSASCLAFAWRYNVLKRKALKALYSIPSILVSGPKKSGKSSIVKLIANKDVSEHIFRDDISLCRVEFGGMALQFIELPYIGSMSVADGRLSKLDLKELKKFNIMHFIYLFDMSESHGNIENQLEDFDRIRKTVGGVPFTVIANKVVDHKDGKLSRLEQRFEKLYTISAFRKDGIKSNDISQLRKEFEDVTDLMDSLSRNIENGLKTANGKINGSTLAAQR